MYSNGEIFNYYLDNEDLASATILSETEDMSAIVEKQYYVTDGSIIRFWDGKSFDSKYFGNCKF